MGECPECGSFNQDYETQDEASGYQCAVKYWCKTCDCVWLEYEEIHYEREIISHGKEWEE